MRATALVICVAALVGIAAAEEFGEHDAIPGYTNHSQKAVKRITLAARLLRPGKVGSKSATSHPRTANPAA